MYLLTAPTLEPVTVSDAKFAARVDGSHWDVPIAGMIAAARQVAEHETGQRLMLQTWRHELEDWPAADDLLPELRPSAVAVSYWSAGSAWASLAAEAYVWAPAGPALWSIALAPAIGTSWPALGDVAIGPRVRIDVTSGSAGLTAPPAAVQFIKALVALMVADPTLTAQDVLAANAYLRHMLDPIRIYR